MISVIATIELVPGCREAFLSEFGNVVPKVLQEAGCTEYCPMVELPTSIGAQSPARDNVVIVIEKWEDLESLEAHLMAPHMVEYRNRVKAIVARAGLQVLTPP